MNKVAWSVGVFLFLVAINSKQSSNNVRIDPSTPIRRSIIGVCDCPYDLDSEGYSCGNRSAYVKYGGREPQCFAYDLGYC
jgi:hypothetical protein